MTTVTPKKRGRPATGRDELVPVRMPTMMLSRIRWWADEFGGMDRSAAIRCLIELGLSRKGKEDTVTDPKYDEMSMRSWNIPQHKRAKHRRKQKQKQELPPPKVPIPPPPDDDLPPSPPEERRHPIRVLPKSAINAAVERAIARSNSNGKERS